MELVALRIEITQNGNDYVYPDFNRVGSANRGNVDWTKYIDQFGGWFYDQCCGFLETDEESPDEGVRIGMFCVPEGFAIDAVTLFPERVSVVDEATFEKFHDNRAKVQVPVEQIMPEIINGLRAKYGQASGPLDTSVMTDEEQQMMDPKHPRPGIVRSKKRKFADVKKARNLILKTLD